MAALAQLERTQVCKGPCGQELPYGDFRLILSGGKYYRAGKCRLCERHRAKQHYEEIKHTPEFKARSEHQKQKRLAKKKRQRRARRKLERKRLVASIPTPVIRPYVLLQIRQVQSTTNEPELLVGRWPGLGILEHRTNVSSKVLRRILDQEQRMVSLDVCERILMQTDTGVWELQERAREWAELTGDEWPIGYHPRTNFVPA